MGAQQRLSELGIELPAPATPLGTYVPAVQSGNLLFLSGQGPRGADGSTVRGKVGADLDLEAGIAAARLVGLGLLATMQDFLGTLDRVSRVVKVLGMVNCHPGFDQMPRVINGCSDLFVEVFGEKGRHARSAVGMAELPSGIPVEIEAIIEIAGS